MTNIVKEYGGLAIVAGVTVLAISYLAKQQAAKLANAVAHATQAAGEKIGVTLYDWVESQRHPEMQAPMESWAVTFPDGSRRAVDSVQVDRNGFFNYWRDNVRYKLMQSADGKKYAVAV